MQYLTKQYIQNNITNLNISYCLQNKQIWKGSSSNNCCSISLDHLKCTKINTAAIITVFIPISKAYITLKYTEFNITSEQHSKKLESWLKYDLSHKKSFLLLWSIYTICKFAWLRDSVIVISNYPLAKLYFLQNFTPIPHIYIYETKMSHRNKF